MKTPLLLRLTFVLASVCPLLIFADTPKNDPTRWEGKIAEIEAKSTADSSKKGALLFVGSSSIVRWDLDPYWPGETVLNHGFGGSIIEDSVYFFDRVVTPYAPRAIIFYAGDNDVARGHSPEQVSADFQRFVELAKAKLPEVPLLFVSIKPSVKRWEMWPQMKAANEAIAKLCAEDENLYYVDVATPMLADDGGMPSADWFVKDGLHLTPKAYELWTQVISEQLRLAKAIK